MGRDSVGSATQVLDLDSGSDELTSLSYTLEVVKCMELGVSVIDLREFWGRSLGCLLLPGWSMELSRAFRSWWFLCLLS